MSTTGRAHARTTWHLASDPVPTGPLTVTGIGVVGGWHVPTVWYLGTTAGVYAVPGNAAHDALLESWREAFRASDAPVSARVRLDAAGAPVVEAG